MVFSPNPAAADLRCGAKAVPFSPLPLVVLLTVWRAGPSMCDRHPATQLQPVETVRDLRPRRGGPRWGRHPRRRIQRPSCLTPSHLPDEWKLPIVIDLRPPAAGAAGRAAARAAAARADLLGPQPEPARGLKIELDLLTGDAGPRHAHPRRNRAHAPARTRLPRQPGTSPSAGQGYTAPPPWLVEGFSAYLENVEDGVSASMFAALLPTSTGAPGHRNSSAREPGAMDFHLARRLPGLRVSIS